MHPRNRHQSRYDLKLLMQACPELTEHVFVNQYGDESIDFSNPLSVKFLNKAILKSTYGIQWWDLPEQYLCPPIPGRADYIHHLADLIGQKEKVLALDVGVGANCVYPLIGLAEYGWSFIGSEIDSTALAAAEKIVRENNLGPKIDLRLQTDPKSILTNIIRSGDQIDLTLCNPPFHSSAAEAQKVSDRKIKNLKLKPKTLNFGGKSHELWCPGGELAFVTQMMEESVKFQDQCTWFTSLISKKEHLPALKDKLYEFKVPHHKIIEMSQGQKASRLLAWTYKSL